MQPSHEEQIFLLQNQIDALRGQSLASQAIIDILTNTIAALHPTLPQALLNAQAECFDHLPSNISGTVLDHFQNRWNEFERIARHHLPKS
ncbi:hypothetical protein [Delftia tsuruhatensis]|uniref:hypothetical protein n=1 Tax=Delftia tsuruhatensis TaxID=180282 RepID=UPI00370B5582